MNSHQAASTAAERQARLKQSALDARTRSKRLEANARRAQANADRLGTIPIRRPHPLQALQFRAHPQIAARDSGNGSGRIGSRGGLDEIAGLAR